MAGSTNKMEQVAALFGKKLNEEFTVKYQYYDGLYKVRFTKHGLEMSKRGYFAIETLLTGETVIVDGQ